MSVNLDVQRLYDRVELVAGIGDPNLDRFCVMSFVAFLAGEWFGDRPKTASQVIRKLVIPLNDRMRDDERQRLKPFAPRIIGTNDGHDADRAEVVFAAVMGEILPKALREHGAPGDVALMTAAELARAVLCLDRRARMNVEHVLAARRDRRLDVLAKESGHLIATLADTAPSEARRSWYVAEAIGLLDRLCDVGADHRQPLLDEAGRPTSALQPSA